MVIAVDYHYFISQSKAPITEGGGGGSNHPIVYMITVLTLFTAAVVFLCELWKYSSDVWPRQ